MKKLTLLAAVGIGYVLGTRAGRGRYEQIKQQAEKVWSNDAVQSTVDKAQEAAKHTASDVGHRVAETAKDVSSTVSDKVGDRVKTAGDFSSSDEPASADSTVAAPEPTAAPDAGLTSEAAAAPEAEADAPGYSSPEGLRADAAAADALSSYDIDEAGSDDLAAPDPLSDDRGEGDRA